MKSSFEFVLSAITALLLHTTRINAFPERWAFDATPAVGPCEAKFVSDSEGMDFPKMSCINDTGFDWWYV